MLSTVHRSRTRFRPLPLICASDTPGPFRLGCTLLSAELAMRGLSPAPLTRASRQRGPTAQRHSNKHVLGRPCNELAQHCPPEPREVPTSSRSHPCELTCQGPRLGDTLRSTESATRGLSSAPLTPGCAVHEGPPSPRNPKSEPDSYLAGLRPWTRTSCSSATTRSTPAATSAASQTGCSPPSCAQRR